jgi:hypothetical protein
MWGAWEAIIAACAASAAARRAACWGATRHSAHGDDQVVEMLETMGSPVLPPLV